MSRQGTKPASSAIKQFKRDIYQNYKNKTMATPQQRPKAGPMKVTCFTKVSEDDWNTLAAKAFAIDRPVSYLVRRALIEAGYIGEGK